MEASSTHSWRWRALSLVVAALALTLVATATLMLRNGRPGYERGPAAAEPAAADVPILGATRFRIATFNVLGAGHTQPGGDTRGYASGEQRMVYTVQILNKQRIDVVGFQEMREVQYDKFIDLTDGTWGTYPGQTINERAGANNIAWRTDTWTLLSANTIKIPYFTNEIPMPYVELAHVLTGQRIFVGNFHNPSDKFGDESRDRREAVRREIALANRLRAENPGVPVHFTGDFNARAQVYCPFAKGSELRAANGGWIGEDGTCHPPASPTPVDWLFGTAPSSFSDYLRLRDALVQKATDHPVVIANVSLPPVAAQLNPVDHVVVLAVDGLRSGAIQRLGAENLPGFYALIARGASTLNARTVVERTTPLPNVVSMLTGIPVSPAAAGHGVWGDGASPTTIHASAGRYVPSVFDLIHDRGLTTAVFAATHDLDVVDRSWSAGYGAADRNWIDNGRDKIDSYVVDEYPPSLVSSLKDRLKTAPATYTFAQLNRPDLAGHRFGFDSDRYLRALQLADRQLRSIVNTIRASPLLNGRTLLIVTGTHGGVGTSNTDPAIPANFRIPFFVSGPGVAAGAQLYDLNPDYTGPWMARTDYSGPPPIRNADAANFALAALGLPALRGSAMNYLQKLTVYAASAPPAAPTEPTVPVS